MSWEPFDREDLDRAGYAITGEQKNKVVTPFFRYESVLNEPQSQLQGKKVNDLIEVVEVRFAANPQYKPVFRVDEMAEMDANGRVITYAERYKTQYQAFLVGSDQVAEGTPLEELLSYGISQAHLSLCRALNIYSVEALAHLEGGARKRLGQHGNDLIPMAKRYLEARRDGSQAQTEINELKRQLAALQGAQQGMVEEMILSTAVPEVVPDLPDGYEDMTDAQLKDAIEDLTGARPRGNPARATIVSLYEQAKAA